MGIQMKIQCLYTHADACIHNNMLSGTFCCTVELSDRPIGISDTARRIISKAILNIIREHDVGGCLQLCAGQISGIEAAVHAVRTLFKKEETEALLLVDASNAFNSLNRQTALLNIQRLCPSLATILINTYRAPYLSCL